MAKVATEKSTKAATKGANTKTKAPKEEKTKRAPSAYNNFVSAHMKPWLAENPGMTNKDGMRAIGVMWKTAPENPNAGKEVKPRKPKASKEPKEKVEKENKKAKASKVAQSSSSDVEELEVGSSEE